MESSHQHLPNNLIKIAKAVSSLTKSEKDSGIEDIENELMSVLSIYSEEVKEIPISEYECYKVDIWKFNDVIYKILEFNLFTRELKPYTLVLQENETKFSEHFLRFIPLFRIRIFFPFSYPKVTPPIMHFTSNWLGPKYLSQLQNQLENMWSTSQLIVFEWINYIQQDFLESLDFIKDRRITLPKSNNYNNMIEYLVQFDAEKDKQEFNNSQVICDICMATSPGTNFVRLPGCKHYCCKACYISYMESLILGGKISQICCFTDGCKKQISDVVLKNTLPEDLYEKYETFSLNKALETFEDVAWCPQCEGPAFKENPKATVAFCTPCDFRFCITCRDRYHPFQRCKALEISKEVSKKDLEKAIVSNKCASNTLSTIYIKKYTKQCPNCGTPILKNGGCNKVICSKCNKFFCWLCLKIIHGYEHFGDKCILFTQESLREDYAHDINTTDSEFTKLIQEELLEEQKYCLSECPKCSTVNIKSKKINLINCDSCHITYCFFCGLEADEEHFKVSTCLKYS